MRAGRFQINHQGTAPGPLRHCQGQANRFISADPAMKPSHPAHFQRIDLLRGVAILLVFLHHYWLAVVQNEVLRAAAVPGGPEGALFRLHEFGFLGVKLFFVISGFCIHNSYLNWRKRSAAAVWRDFLPGFAHRRFWRIWPPYALALLAFFLWRYEHPLSVASLKHLALHGALVNTLVPGFFYNINPSFWSIAVEWQLYLVYPLLLGVAVRFGMGWTFAVATLVAGVFQLLAPLFTEAPWVRFLPFSWWYDWAVGAWLAARFSEGRRVFGYHVWTGTGLGVATMVVLIYWPRPFLTWLLPPLFFAVLLEGCLWSSRPLARWERAFGALGLCSYSFYLLHQPLSELWVSGSSKLPVSIGFWTVWLTSCGAL
jgi:peptidoglycan/LPS O-acetylase OafA/YrhL